MSAIEDEVREVAVTDPKTLAVLTGAEIDKQISTAHAFPRSIKRFRNNTLELVTLTEDVARECIYALPARRGGNGKPIEGPSARFAEVLAHSWGNCRVGGRVVDEGNEFVVSQGVFQDLETNTVITFEARRRIVDKEGRRFSPDMIAVTANAATSIAIRNAVLKGIPKALWSDTYEAARRVIVGDATTLAERRAKALQVMQSFGLDEAGVCKVLKVDGVADIGLDELATLNGLRTALKEGDTTVEQLLAEAGGEVATSASPLSPTATAAKPAASDKPAPESKQPEYDKAALLDLLAKAQGPDDIAFASDMAKGLPPADRDEVLAACAEAAK